jgi:thioredoxin-related protein
MYRAAVLIATLALLSPTASLAAEFPWFKGDFEAVSKAGKSKQRKVLLTVSTTWCEPCHRLKEKVFASDEMVALSDQFFALEVNAETPKGRKLMEQFRVERYPTTIFLSAEGKEEGRVVGFRELPGFLLVMNQWLGGTLAAPSEPTEESALEAQWARAFRVAYGGKDVARAELQKVADGDAGNTKGLQGLARLAIAERLELATGDAAAAVKQLEALRTELGGTQAATLAALPLARAHAKAGKPSKGLELLAAEHKNDKDLGSLWRLLHFAAFTPGVDPQKALDLAKASIAKHDTHDEVWDLVGELEAKRGRDAQAVEAWRKAAALRPDLAYYAAKIEKVSP